MTRGRAWPRSRCSSGTSEQPRPPRLPAGIVFPRPPPRPSGRSGSFRIASVRPNGRRDVGLDHDAVHAKRVAGLAVTAEVEQRIPRAPALFAPERGCETGRREARSGGWARRSESRRGALGRGGERSSGGLPGDSRRQATAAFPPSSPPEKSVMRAASARTSLRCAETRFGSVIDSARAARSERIDMTVPSSERVRDAGVQRELR